jgi:ABC-type branched-subunit amino acid transport system substrate-binding protein
MKRTATLFSVFLLVLSLLLSSCAQTQPPAAGGSEGQAPVAAKETMATIGFTASQTGSLNVESIRQINGLNLWMKHINAAGGLELGDGSVVKFQSRFYDDESNKDRVQELYTRLATEDDATFMISPYSSGLADASAVIAEQYGKILITTGAASDSTYQKSYTLVYQAYTPASKYLTGAIDLLMDTDPSIKKIAIVHENDKFSTDVSTALNAYALAKGYEVVLFEGYDSDTADFGPFINKIQQTSPDAIMGGGHFQDGTTFAKQLFEKKVPVKFASLLVAPPEPTFSELGDAAVGIIGPSQWEPLAAFTSEAAQKAGIEWYGITGEEFVNDYQASYSEEPSYHSAGGYVAGLILQKAIEEAGTLDTLAVKAALDSMDILTFFGHIKFDTSPENHGLQIGHSMVYIQWGRNSAGTLEKQVVWPSEGKTAEIIYPIR